MRRLVTLVALAAATLVPPQAAASALVVATVPGSEFTGYGTPVVAIPEGGPLTFVNADPVSQLHDVVAYLTYGHDDQPWCDLYVAGRCPLFWTPLIGVTRTTPVLGLDRTPPGIYEFFCTIHPLQMHGTLVVG